MSLTVENGKKVGLVGKSGEGKSTLANIVCGLVAPSEGRVLIDGQPLWSEKNRYDKKVGMAIQLIPQKPLLALDPSQRIGSAIKEALVLQNTQSAAMTPHKRHMRFLTRSDWNIRWHRDCRCI